MFNTCQILLILVLGAGVTDCWEVGGRPVRRVAVWRTRAFLCVPRSDDEDAEAPATLLEAVWPEKGSIPSSYPNFDMQEVGNCFAFQSVVALDVEAPRARLWVLDAGGHGCEPKLVIFDLINNKELLHIELTDTPGKWLSSLVVDSTGSLAPRAYIGDSGRGGLLVYSLRDRRWWQLDLKDAGTPVIAWDLALSRREPLLYITSPDTEMMFGLNLIDLRRNHAPPVYDSRPVAETASVQVLGRKLGLSAGLAMDHRAGLHYFLLRDSSVVRWDTRRPLSPEAHSVAFHSTELLPVTAHLFVCPHRQVWAVVSTENKHPLPDDLADDIILSRNIRQIYDNVHEGTFYTSDKLDTTHDTPATESLSNYLQETLREYYREEGISEHPATFNIFGANGEKFSDDTEDITNAADTQDNVYATTEREFSTPLGLENNFQTPFQVKNDQIAYEHNGQSHQTSSDFCTFDAETEEITEDIDQIGTSTTETLLTLQSLFWNSSRREDEETVKQTESSNFTNTILRKTAQNKPIKVESGELLGYSRSNSGEMYNDRNQLVTFENSQQTNQNENVKEYTDIVRKNAGIMDDFTSLSNENKTEGSDIFLLNQSEIKTDRSYISQNIPTELYLRMIPESPLLHEADEIPSVIRINRESALNNSEEKLKNNGENQLVKTNPNAEVRDFESIMIDQGGIDSTLEDSFEIPVNSEEMLKNENGGNQLVQSYPNAEERDFESIDQGGTDSALEETFEIPVNSEEMLKNYNGENQLVKTNPHAEDEDFESIMIDQGGIDSRLEGSFKAPVATDNINTSPEYLEELPNRDGNYFDGEIQEQMPFSALGSIELPSSVLFTSIARSTMSSFPTLSIEEVTLITEDKDEGVYDNLPPGPESVDELQKLRFPQIANEQLAGNVSDNRFIFDESVEQILSISANPLYMEGSQLIDVNNVSTEHFLSGQTSIIPFSEDGEYNNTSVPSHDLVGVSNTDNMIYTSSDNYIYFPNDEEVSCGHRLEEGAFCSDSPSDTSHSIGQGLAKLSTQSSPYETDFSYAILDEYPDKELRGINRLPDEDIDVLHLIPEYSAERIQDTARDPREMSNIIRSVQKNDIIETPSSDESSRSEDVTEENNDTSNLHSKRRTDTAEVNLSRSVDSERPNTHFKERTPSSIVSYEAITSVDIHINSSAFLDNINVTDIHSMDEPTTERTRHDTVEYTDSEDDSSTRATSHSVAICDLVSNSMKDESVTSRGKLIDGTTFSTEKTDQQQVNKINIEKSKYYEYLITDEHDEESVTRVTQPSSNNSQSATVSTINLISSQNDARIIVTTGKISRDSIESQSEIHSQKYASITEAYSDSVLDQNRVNDILLGPNDLQPVIRSFRALPKQYSTTASESSKLQTRSTDSSSENGVETIHIPFYSEIDEKPDLLRATNADGTEIYLAPPNKELKIQLPDIAVSRKESVEERPVDNNIASNAYSDASETQLHMNVNVQEQSEPSYRTQPLWTKYESNEKDVNCIEKCLVCESIPSEEWSNHQDRNSIAHSERLSRRAEEGRQGEDKINLENIGINTVKYLNSRRPTFLIDLRGEDVPENDDHKYARVRLVCNREGTLPATEVENHAVVSRSQNSPGKRENLNSNRYQDKGNSDIYLGIEPDDSAVDFKSTDRQDMNTFRRGKPISARENSKEQPANELYFSRKSGEPLRIGSLGSYSREVGKKKSKTNDGSWSTVLLDSILGIASDIAKAFIPSKEKSKLPRVSSGRTMNRGTSNFVRKPAVSRITKPKGRDDVVSLVAQCYGEECHAMVLLDKNKAQNVKEFPLRSPYSISAADKPVVTPRKRGENSAIYNYDRSRPKNPLTFSAGGTPVRFTVKLGDVDGVVKPNENMNNLVLYINSNEDLRPAKGSFDEKEIMNPARTFYEDVMIGLNRLSRASLTSDPNVVTNDTQFLYSANASDMPNSNLANGGYLRLPTNEQAENSEEVFSDSVDMSHGARPSGVAFNSSNLSTLEEDPTLLTNSAEDMQVSVSRKKSSVSICYDNVSSPSDTDKHNCSNSSFEVHAVEMTETAGERHIPELLNKDSVDIFSGNVKTSYVSYSAGADEQNLSNSNFKVNTDKIIDTAVEMQEPELLNQDSMEIFSDNIKTSYVASYPRTDEHNSTNSSFSTLNEQYVMISDASMDMEVLESRDEGSVEVFTSTVTRSSNVLPSRTAKPYFSNSKPSSFTVPITESTMFLNVENPLPSKSDSRFTSNLEGASSDVKVEEYLNSDFAKPSNDSQLTKTMNTLVSSIRINEISSKNNSGNAPEDSGQNIRESMASLVSNQTERPFMMWTVNMGNSLSYFDKLVTVSSKEHVKSAEGTVDEDGEVTPGGESIEHVKVLHVTETNKLASTGNLMDTPGSDRITQFQNIKNIYLGNMRGSDGENTTDPSLTLSRVLLNSNTTQMQSPPSLKDAQDDNLNKEAHETSLSDTKREGRELSEDGVKIWSNRIMDANVVDTPSVGLASTTTSTTTEDSDKGGNANRQNILIKINTITQPYVQIPRHEHNPSTVIRVSDPPSHRRHSGYTRKTRQNKRKGLIPKAFQFISLSSNLKTWTVHCVLIQKYPPHIP